MPPPIILRRLPGVPGLLLAVALLLSSQREIAVDLRPGPFVWLVFRLSLGPALLLLALVVAGRALGVLVVQHGLAPL